MGKLMRKIYLGKKRIDGECDVCLIFEVGDDEKMPTSHKNSSGKENQPDAFGQIWHLPKSG